MNRLTGPLAALTLLAVSSAWAGGQVMIQDPWVREVPPTSQVTAGYMVVMNHADQANAIVGASSPAFPKVEIHQTVAQPNGMMGMVMVPAIELPVHGTVTLAPGGYHLMLIGGQPLREGTEVPLTLHLKNGEKVEVKAVVKKAPAQAAGQSPAMDHTQHMQQMEHLKQMPQQAVPAAAPAAMEHKH